MTDAVPFNERITELEPAALTLALPFTFPIDRPEDLTLQRSRDGAWSVLAYPADYHFPDGIGDGSGGTAHLRAGSLDGDRYLLVGTTEVHRESDYQVRGSVPSQILNADMNRLVRMLQEATRDARLALKMLPSIGTGLRYVPPPIAGAMLLWNATLDGLENGPVADQIANAQGFAEQAQEFMAGAEGFMADAAYWASLAAAIAVPNGSVTFAKLAAALVQTSADAIDATKDDEIPTVKRVKELIDAQTDRFKIGDIKWVTHADAESGWADADGSAISRTGGNAGLFAKLVTGAGFSAQTFTVTIASPGIFTKVAHGFHDGERVRLATTGALPTGLANNIDYYVIVVDADHFKVSATPDGTPINTTGGQSGTHSYMQSLWGLGDGSTTFNLPLIDEFVRGTATGRRVGTRRKETIGPHSHGLVMNPMSPHAHTASAQARHGANGNSTGVFRPSDGDSTNGSSPTLNVSSVSAGTPTGTVQQNTDPQNWPLHTVLRALVKVS